MIFPRIALLTSMILPFVKGDDDYRLDNRPMGKFEILPVGDGSDGEPYGSVDPQEDNTALIDIFLEVHKDYETTYTVVVYDMEDPNNENTSLGADTKCSEGRNADTLEDSKFTFTADSAITSGTSNTEDTVIRNLEFGIGLEPYKQNLPDDDGFKYDFCVRFGYKFDFIEGDGSDEWVSYQDTRVVITKTVTGFFGDWDVINIAVADKDGEQLEESNEVEVDLTAFLCDADNTTLGDTPQEPVFVLGQDMKLCVEVDDKDDYYINKFKDVNCTYESNDEIVVREIIQAGDPAQSAITRIAKYKHQSDYETGIHFTTVVTPDFVSNDNTRINCTGEVSLFQITSAPTSSPTSSPSEAPSESQAPSESPPEWNDLYVIQTSDTCDNLITDISECGTAYSGYDTSATKFWFGTFDSGFVESSNGNGPLEYPEDAAESANMPSGCFFYNGAGYLEPYHVTGSTTNDCSQNFPCICKKPDRRQLEAPVERTVRFRMKASPSAGRELQEVDDEGFTAGGEFAVQIRISSGGFSLGGVGASLVMMMGLVVVTLL